MTGAITHDYFDVAQLTLWGFWIFFAALILYIRKEDKREGFPLVSDLPGRVALEEGAFMPKPKTFLTHAGETILAPRFEAPEAEPKATPIAKFPGAPLEPDGDPMLAGVGPGSWANRQDVPELLWETGHAKIVPLRADHEFSIPSEDPDPRGLPVVGADKLEAGICVDAWVDRSETILRYLEIKLTSGKVVLVPMTFVTIGGKPRQIRVKSILSTQFENVPTLAQGEQITKLEEDKVCAYYGGGTLYATPERSESLI
jgi:photosynthetic reaction center H subunit